MHPSQGHIDSLLALACGKLTAHQAAALKRYNNNLETAVGFYFDNLAVAFAVNESTEAPIEHCELSNEDIRARGTKPIISTVDIDIATTSPLLPTDPTKAEDKQNGAQEPLLVGMENLRAPLSRRLKAEAETAKIRGTFGHEIDGVGKEMGLTRLTWGAVEGRER